MTQPLVLVPSNLSQEFELGLSDMEVDGEPIADQETAAWIAAYCAGEPGTAIADAWIAGRRWLLEQPFSRPHPRLALPLAA